MFKTIFIKIIEDPEVQAAACKIVQEVLEQTFSAFSHYITDNFLIKFGYKLAFNIFKNVAV
jgi:hypothetical protein